MVKYKRQIWSILSTVHVWHSVKSKSIENCVLSLEGNSFHLPCIDSKLIQVLRDSHIKVHQRQQNIGVPSHHLRGDCKLTRRTELAQTYYDEAGEDWPCTREGVLHYEAHLLYLTPYRLIRFRRHWRMSTMPSSEKWPPSTFSRLYRTWSLPWLLPKSSKTGQAVILSVMVEVCVDPLWTSSWSPQNQPTRKPKGPPRHPAAPA